MSLRYLLLVFLPFFSQAQMDTSQLEQDAELLLGLSAGMDRTEVETRWGEPNLCIEENQYCVFGPTNGLKMWFDEKQRLRKVSLQSLSETDPIVRWLGEHFEHLSVVLELIFTSPQEIKNRFGQASKEDMIGDTLIYNYHLPNIKYSFFFQGNSCIQVTLAWLHLK